MISTIESVPKYWLVTSMTQIKQNVPMLFYLADFNWRGHLCGIIWEKGEKWNDPMNQFYDTPQ